MAIRGNSITINYVAWNTSNNAGQTGDASNHTIKLVKDGTAATATNSPSEVDSTNAPGVYKLVLTGTEMTCDCITVCGKSSTSNVSIIPLTITTEHGVLPNVQQGNAGAVITAGTGTAQLNVSSGHVANVDTLTTYTGNTVQTGDAYARLGAPAGASIAADLAEIEAETDGIAAIPTNPLLASSAPANFGSLAITAGGAVTVGTNNDKTGYQLSSAGLDLVVIETGLNARQAISIIAAAEAGKTSGQGTAPIFLGAGVSTQRISGTVDGSGNRTAVTLSPPT